MRSFSVFSVQCSDMNETLYWLETGGEASGPFTAGQIREMFRTGAIPATAQVCPRGGRAWQPVLTLMEVMGARDTHAGTYRVLALLFGTMGVHNLYAGEMGRFLVKLVLGFGALFLFLLGAGLEVFGWMLFAALLGWTLVEIISGPAPRESLPSPPAAPPAERTPEEQARVNRRNTLIIVAVLLAMIVVAWLSELQG